MVRVVIMPRRLKFEKIFAEISGIIWDYPGFSRDYSVISFLHLPS